MVKKLRRLSVLIYFMVGAYPAAVSAQGSDSVVAYRGRLIKEMRDYRRDLAGYDILVADSVSLQLDKAILYLQQADDTFKLGSMYRYFSNVRVLSNREDKDVLHYINKDIRAKVFYAEKYSELQLEPASFFANPVDVVIKAVVRGAASSDAQYRVFWATNHGEPDENVIRRNQPEGFSLSVKSPFTLKMILPGVITIWMKDLNNRGKLYKADISPATLLPDVKTLDVYFSEL